MERTHQECSLGKGIHVVGDVGWNWRCCSCDSHCPDLCTGECTGKFSKLKCTAFARANILQGSNRFLFFELHTRKQPVKHINLVYKLPLLKENPTSVFSAYLHPYQAHRYKLVCWFLDDIRTAGTGLKRQMGFCALALASPGVTSSPS